MARDGDNLFLRGRVWYFKYKGADGKYHEQSTGKQKKTEARSVRDERMATFRQGQLPEAMGKWTLARAVEERLAYRGVTMPKSHRIEATSLRAVVRILGPQKRLEQITNSDLEHYQVVRSQEQTRQGTRVQPRTVNLEILYLSAILKRAKLWARLADGYRRLKVDREGPGWALTPDQVMHLVETGLSNPEWVVALCASILSACATGVRSCEIKGLRLGDLHFSDDQPCLIIRRQSTKTDAGARTYPLNRFARWAIERLFERAHLLGASSPDHYLLPVNRSKHTRPDDPRRGQSGYDASAHQSSWRSAWHAMRTAAGFPKLRFHDLRHTFITQGAEADVPILVMESLVGHMSPEMIRKYTHIHDNAKVKAVRAIEQHHPALLQLLTAGESESSHEEKSRALPAAEVVSIAPQISREELGDTEAGVPRC
jgi:integrase